METKLITICLKEAEDFAKENGYLLAVYQKDSKDGHYHLISDFNDLIPENTSILIQQDYNGQKNFNEFITEDKEYCFRLHNNFNLPKIIPVFTKNSKLYIQDGQIRSSALSSFYDNHYNPYRGPY